MVSMSSLSRWIKSARLASMREGVTDLARTEEPRATRNHQQEYSIVSRADHKRTVPAQQNRRRSHTALLGDSDNRLSCEQGAAGAAQGTIRGDVDALLVAEVDDLLLRQGGVVLDLVGGGDDARLGQELLQILDAVVGDADGLDLAGVHEILHALPRCDMRVAVDDIPRAVGQLGEDGVGAW